MSADDDLDLTVEIQEDPPTGPGTAQQPPRTDPITDPPPRHDPYAHGAGPPPPPPPPSFDQSWQDPPRPPGGERRLRGDDKRLHDKLTQAYATVGLVVCAAAATRMNVLGPTDPIGAPHDPDRERARHATILMNQAGVQTVNMAPAAADAWLDVSKEIPAVRKALEGFMEGGAVLGLVGVHAMILIPYAVAAGLVPEIIGERLGAVGNAMGAAATNGNGN